MLFSSMIFLFIFLPVTFVGYKIIPKKNVLAGNIFLLVMSCIFYAWGGLSYFAIMLGSICINYAGGILVSTQNRKRARLFLILVIAANLGLLFYFKYFNFFIDILSAVASRDINIAKVVLPIGISFFTFQAMSYVIDVYRKEAAVQKNFFSLALYISLFPQLIAGPIVKYGDIDKQILNRQTDAEKTWTGLKRFCFGLAKKVIISNLLAETVDNIFNKAPSQLGSGIAWLGVLFYALQIYYDFSGYSDMAIGLGKMFGFEFKENFNYPYTAQSIQDFWRRWHISLSTWFKEYVYIPLGGNRKGKLRTYFNLAVVFVLTGLWHGANYTFLAWGIYFGLFLIIEKLFLGALLKKNKRNVFFNWVYMFVVVLTGWVFFRSPNISYAFKYIGEMFSFKGGELPSGSLITTPSLVVLPFALLFCGFLQRATAARYSVIAKHKAMFWVESAVMAALLLLCVLMLAGSAYNPFIYFQF